MPGIFRVLPGLLAVSLVLLPFAAPADTPPLDVSAADPDVQSFHSIDNASRALYAGQNALQNGRYEEALEQYTIATDADPSWLAAWYLKAYSLSKLNRHEEALAAVDRALALDPSDRDSNNLRAEILVRLGRSDEAIRFWRTPVAQQGTPVPSGATTTPRRTSVSLVSLLSGLACVVIAAGLHGTGRRNTRPQAGRR